MTRRRRHALALDDALDCRRVPVPRSSRAGVEVAHDHFATAGLADELITELLRRQWVTTS